MNSYKNIKKKKIQKINKKLYDKKKLQMIKFKKK